MTTPLTDHIQQAHRILDNSLIQFRPSTVVLCFSGGYDSAVASHLTARWARSHAHSTNLISLAVDTRIAADGWQAYVRQTARTMGLPRFRIRRTTQLPQWLQRCVKNGFPYTPAQHKISFYHLKQYVFRQVLKELKKFWRDRILFVNGVRRDESTDRQTASTLYRQGSMAHVSPLIDWKMVHIESYRHQHDLPENPFYNTIGNSGDCLCNWHRQFDMATLKQYARQALYHLQPVDTVCRATHGYGYGQAPPPGAFSDGPTQLSLFDLPGIHDTPNLCRNCRTPQPSNEARDFVTLQRMDWTS